MTEKIALADGRADAAALFAGCRDAASRLVAFDMAAIAEATGSVISAVLFGALAGSGALPFVRTAFEAAIRRGQVGVEASLAAFAAGFEAAQSGAVQPALPPATERARQDAPAAVRELLAQAERVFSGEARSVVAVAIERLLDYQDADYAKAFLSRLQAISAVEQRHGDGSGGCWRKPRVSWRSACATKTPSG